MNFFIRFLCEYFVQPIKYFYKHEKFRKKNLPSNSEILFFSRQRFSIIITAVTITIIITTAVASNTTIISRLHI